MNRLSSRALIDPKGARAEILAALTKARCDHTVAAEALDMHPGTLRRLISALRLRPAVLKMHAEAKAAGWHHGRVGGRPKTKPGLRPRPGRGGVGSGA